MGGDAEWEGRQNGRGSRRRGEGKWERFDRGGEGEGGDREGRRRIEGRGGGQRGEKMRECRGEGRGSREMGGMGVVWVLGWSHGGV